jgi:hypothetical protein
MKTHLLNCYLKKGGYKMELKMSEIKNLNQRELGNTLRNGYGENKLIKIILDEEVPHNWLSNFLIPALRCAKLPFAVNGGRSNIIIKWI